MSTTPTEAHRKLACEILMEHSVSGAATKEGVIAAAQLLRDSEARAVEAATKKQPISTHLRQFDLVRFMRRELLDAELITEEEYAWLCMESPMARGSGSPSPRRLEDYDKIKQSLTAERERVRVLREALEFLLIGYEGHYETGKCDTNCAVQARAALAANSEHAKEGSK